MKQFLIVLVAMCSLLPVSISAHGNCNRITDFLGIKSSSISEQKAEKLGFDNPYGSYISEVYENSTAEKAGLQPFDYIFWVGKYVACHDRDVANILNEYDAGDEVEVRFVRNGQLYRSMVQLGEKGETRMSNKSCDSKPFFGIEQNYRAQRNIGRGVGIDVVNNSTAEEMGLEDGDVLLSINEHPMVDWNDVTVAINELEVGENIAVEFIRDGQTSRANMPIKSYNDTKNRSYNNNSQANSGGGYDYREPKEERYEKRYEEPKNNEKEVEDENREYGFLGVYSENVSKEKAQKLGFENPYGSYVTGVIPGTAAEKAGVQPFDYIYGVDQYRTGENQNLTHIFRKYEPKDRATLQLVRDKRKQSLPVTFGSRDDVQYQEKSKCQEPFFGIRHDHSRSINVDGVAIEVVSNSTAKGLGLEDGDIITQINGHYMIDWKDIGIAIDNMTIGNTITVAYLRNGKRMTQQGPIQSYCDTKPEYKQKEQVWNQYENKNTNKNTNTNKNKNKNSDSHDNDIFDNELIITKNDYFKTDHLNMSNMTVRISDVNSGEARGLQQRFGQPMGNDLVVDNFRLSKNTDQNLFDLTFDLPSRGETIVKIINDDGRVIYEYDLGQFSGDFSDKVDISQNGTGAYYLSIQSGSKTKTKKIILAKK